MAIRPGLRDELLNLSPDERQELADELYESVVAVPDDPEWQRAWSAEIEQRLDDVVQNRVELIDADEVHRDLQAELQSSRR